MVATLFLLWIADCPVPLRLSGLLHSIIVDVANWYKITELPQSYEVLLVCFPLSTYPFYTGRNRDWEGLINFLRFTGFIFLGVQAEGVWGSKVKRETSVTEKAGQEAEGRGVAAAKGNGSLGKTEMLEGDFRKLHSVSVTPRFWTNICLIHSTVKCQVWRWQGVERESWQLGGCPAAGSLWTLCFEVLMTTLRRGAPCTQLETTWEVPEWPPWEMAPADTKFPVSSWGYRRGHSRLCWEQQNGLPGIQSGRDSVVRSQQAAQPQVMHYHNLTGRLWKLKPGKRISPQMLKQHPSCGGPALTSAGLLSTRPGGAGAEVPRL